MGQHKEKLVALEAFVAFWIELWLLLGAQAPTL